MALLLLIQDDDEVDHAVRILTGNEQLVNTNTIRFSYDRNDNHGWTDYLGEGRVRAALELGDKANVQVRTKLARAFADCTVPGLHLIFEFCNLEFNSILLLAQAVSTNAHIGGFSCTQNPSNFDPKTKLYDPTIDLKVREAVIACPSPHFTTWNKQPLENDVLAARQLYQAMPKHQAAAAVAEKLAVPTETKNYGDDEEDALLKRLEEIKLKKEQNRLALEAAKVEKKSIDERNAELKTAFASQLQHELSLLQKLEDAKLAYEQAQELTAKLKKELAQVDYASRDVEDKILYLESTLKSTSSAAKNLL